MTVETYTDDLLVAFASMLEAERDIAVLKTELDKITTQYSADIRQHENKRIEAMQTLDKLMKEVGVTEETLPGSGGIDYKLYYSTPRESVKVANVDIVPFSFIRVKKEPKLNDIGKHLKTLRDTKQAMPNWAVLENGESKLCWEAVKR